MNEYDDLLKFCKQRLEGTSLPVKEDAWLNLEHDLNRLAGKPSSNVKSRSLFPVRRLFQYAASVILLIGLSTWLLTLYLPDNRADHPSLTAGDEKSLSLPDTKDIPSDQTALRSESPIKPISPLAAASTAHVSVSPAGYPLDLVANNNPVDDEEFHISIQITQRVVKHDDHAPTAESDFREASTGSVSSSHKHTIGNESQASVSGSDKWGVQASIGTSLSVSGYRPYHANVSVERILSDRFSLQTGVRLSRYAHPDFEDLTAVSILLKATAKIATLDKTDLYASGGIVATKVTSNSEDDKPVQLMAEANLGIRYRLNHHFSLFAEPTVALNMTREKNRVSPYSDKSTDLSLYGGIRLTF